MATTVGGRLAWELVEVASGRVRDGQRELRSSDFEVVVLPPPVRPHLGLLSDGLRQAALDSVSWLVKGGRGSTTKSVSLTDGFELVLRERRAPAAAVLVLLGARRSRGRLRTLRWFRVDENGTTATSQEGEGSLTLEWERDRDGFYELVSTTAATDVLLRLVPPQGPIDREPAWLLTILAGSTIRWPPAAAGVRLVPRLRPDRTPPSGCG